MGKCETDPRNQLKTDFSSKQTFVLLEKANICQNTERHKCLPCWLEVFDVGRYSLIERWRTHDVMDFGVRSCNDKSIVVDRKYVWTIEKNYVYTYVYIFADSSIFCDTNMIYCVFYQKKTNVNLCVELCSHRLVVGDVSWWKFVLRKEKK